MRRFAIASIAAFVLMLAFAAIGASLADTIVWWKVTAFAPPGANVVYTSPSEPAMLLFRYAFAFALVPVVAWFAVLIRWLRGGALSLLVIVIYLAVPLAGLAFVIVFPTLVMPSMYPGNVDLKPVIAISDLVPGAWEARSGAAFALGLWAFAWIGGRLPRARR